MFKYFIFLISIILISCQGTQPQNSKKSSFPFYLGSYTDNGSEGIYLYTLEPGGTLQNKGLMAKSINPSYLEISHDNKFLIAVNEIDNENRGGISSFKIGKDSLEQISKIESGGAHPCHLSMDQKGRILVSNYSGGNAALIQMEVDGKLNFLDSKQHTGKSIIKNRQSSPHVHSSYFIDNNLVLSADLGTDALWITPIDEKNNLFIDSSTTFLKIPGGSGPRHMAFTQSKEDLYVVNELNSSINHIKKVKGEYLLQLHYPTLPADYPDESFCADIHLSKDEKFLYASNRGHNSISIFERTNNGELKLLGHENVRGNWPRNFAISPDGNYLVVANQHSNNIISFMIDGKTGLLEFIDEIKAMSPACIRF